MCNACSCRFFVCCRSSSHSFWHSSNSCGARGQRGSVKGAVSNRWWVGETFTGGARLESTSHEGDQGISRREVLSGCCWTVRQTAAGAPPGITAAGLPCGDDMHLHAAACERTHQMHSHGLHRVVLDGAALAKLLLLLLAMWPAAVRHTPGGRIVGRVSCFAPCGRFCASIHYMAAPGRPPASR
jgi:hypothetical protein